jgi:hypothetical protein
MTGLLLSGRTCIAGLLFLSATAQANGLSIRFSEVPPAQTASAHASFDFNASGAVAFQCSLDGASFAACASPHTVLGTDTGAHQLAIRAVDASGLSGPAAVVSWEQLDPFLANHPDLARTTQQPSPAAPNSWRGILRINCDFSHAAYEDPIVYPGQALKAHLHGFYGLLNAGSATSVAGLFRTPGDGEARVSSCQGNDLNRSSYWVPALLAPRYSQAGLRQVDANGDPAYDVVPAVVGNDDVAHEVFYYSAGVDDLASIQPIPTGLVMIAGSMRATPESPQSSSIVRWHCQSWESSDAGNPRFSATIPVCAEPDRLRADIFFPSCWNGTDLDSSDHQSHLAYPVVQSGRSVCPVGHPVPIVRVSYHYAFPVKPENSDHATRSTLGWQLASDMYVVSSNRPGGASLHADWMNGWHPALMESIVQGCIQRGLDCHDGNLGNGFRLGGTVAGHGEVPDVIFEGMGPAFSAVPSLSIGDITLDAPSSGAAIASFQLQLSRPLAQPLTVKLSTRDISAVAGSDYLPLIEWIVQIPAGSTTVPVGVTVLPQLWAERKQFGMSVDAGGAVLVADGYAIAEINGLVAASTLPTIEVHGGRIREGDYGSIQLPFTLTLSGAAPAGGVRAWVSTTRVDGIGGMAMPGVDYASLNRQLVSIPAGATQALVSVKVLGDRWLELNEAVTVQIDAIEGASALASQAIGWIEDNDADASLSTPAATSEAKQKGRQPQGRATLRSREANR